MFLPILKSRLQFKLKKHGDFRINHFFQNLGFKSNEKKLIKKTHNNHRFDNIQQKSLILSNRILLFEL